MPKISSRISDAAMRRLRKALEIDDHKLAFKSRIVAPADGFAVEKLAFATTEGEVVRGVLARPQTGGPWPGILYIHAHGARYDIGADELLSGRGALLGALGPQFARTGYAALMIEMPSFGTRAIPNESARAKALLWRGKSLAGQMLGEQRAAFQWLAGRDDIIADRIGIFGISMGATLGYWLAAVEPRVACVAQLCCFADFASLVATGAHDLHGIYLTVPGLFDIAANGEIAGRIAPRPQLIAIGDRDPLTPPAAFEIALRQTRRAYAAAEAQDQLMVLREPESGHVETPAMRDAVFAFFRRHLALVRVAETR
jgi:dienelactone hydrolase